jgi:hypothetical protein
MATALLQWRVKWHIEMVRCEMAVLNVLNGENMGVWG